MIEPLLSLRGIKKSFGPVQALRDVSMDLFPGEVHVLLGENGAGKSTIVKTMLGVHRADEGQIRFRGAEVSGFGPGEARRLGINAVLQDFSLAPTLTCAENIFLGREPTSRGVILREKMRQEASALMESTGIRLPLNVEVGALTRAQQQLVEIMKGIVGKPGVLLLDEPTASLSEAEASHLFDVVERLRSDGWALMYITHRLKELSRIGDRMTVLRDGLSVSSYEVGEVSESQLVKDMVGRSVGGVHPPKSQWDGAQAPLLEISHLAGADGRVKDVSLTVRQGEIVALAGLVGSGKSDVLRILAGTRDFSGGEVVLGGRKVRHPNARTLLSQGVGFMPEDRARESLALTLSVEKNVNMEAVASGAHASVGFLKLGALEASSSAICEKLDIRPRGVRRIADLLSGGNQQKVVLARALTRDRSILIVAEPTAGVDVGAKLRIYKELREQCNAGVGILLISSDLEEVLGMADRVYVMNDGRVHVELTGSDINEEAVVAGAFAAPRAHEAEVVNHV